MAQEKGILKKVFDTKQVSDKFRMREFIVILQHTTQYPQEVKFQFTQDKCDVIDPYPLGIEVVVDYNLKGRAWTNKEGETTWFNTIEAWKIQHVVPFAKKQESVPTFDYQRNPNDQGKTASEHLGKQDDDLPF